MEARKCASHVHLILSVIPVILLGGAADAATTLFVQSPVSLSCGDCQPAISTDAADVNGDSLPDIVVGINFAAPRLFLNNGSAHPFDGVSGLELSPIDIQQAAMFADVNLDNLPDIVAAGFNSVSRVYVNNGTAAPFTGGSVSALTGIAPTMRVAVADVNGDSIPDIAQANTNHEPSRLYLSFGTGLLFSGSSSIPIGSDAAYASDIKLTDVNGDGLTDAIIAYSAVVQGEPSGIRIFLHNGTGVPYGSSPNQLLVTKTVHSVTFADLNDDDRPDLIASGNESNWVGINSGSAVQPFSDFIVLPRDGSRVASCYATAAADVNADGRKDVLFGCAPATGDRPVFHVLETASIGRIYLNSGGSQPFQAAPIEVPAGETAKAPMSIHAVDFNQNGKLSILVDQRPAQYFPLHLDENPIANDDAASTASGQFADIDVLRNDTDSDGMVARATLRIVSPPLHGVARINTANYTIIYQPDLGFGGSDTFQYAVSDDLGAGSNEGTVSVAVNPPLSSSPSGGGGAMGIWELAILILLGSSGASRRVRGFPSRRSRACIATR